MPGPGNIRNRIFAPLTVVALLALALACSDDDGGSTNGGYQDGGSGPRCADTKLYSCSKVGKTCNAHDPCAINPVCGKDNCCRAQFTQNCDDELACTTDTCAGSGLCSYTVKSDHCMLMVPGTSGSKQTCLKKGAVNPQNPCLQCDPKDPKKWSPASGAKCDDGNSCTKDDKCVSGYCKGTYYGNQCGDGKECTTDLCDGKGACANKMKSDWCRIAGKCVKDGKADANGCAFCDVSVNQFAWTTKKDLCKIGTGCYLKGARDTSGCGICDPAKKTTGWSPAPDRCLIGGLCYIKDELAPSSCARCVPATSSTSFTVLAGKCLIGGKCLADKALSPSGCGTCASSKSSTWWTPVAGAKTGTNGFETGLGGWAASAITDGVGWQVSKVRHRGGNASLYYGNLTKASYDNGKPNKGSMSTPKWALPAGQKAALSFWIYLDVESGSTHDLLTTSVGSKVLWSKASVPLSAYKRWYPVEIDLSAHAGSTIQVKLSFDTKDAWANTGEGIYIDDAMVSINCGKK